MINSEFGVRQQIVGLTKVKNIRFDFHIRKVVITLNVGKSKTGVKTHSPEFHHFGVYRIQCCQLQEAGIVLPLCSSQCAKK